MRFPLIESSTGTTLAKCTGKNACGDRVINYKGCSMSKSCPNCSSKIPFVEFVIPKFHFNYICPVCDAKIEFSGLFYWSSEILLLIITLIIYSAFQNDWFECVLATAATIFFFWIQFKFAELHLVKS